MPFFKSIRTKGDINFRYAAINPLRLLLGIKEDFEGQPEVQCCGPEYKHYRPDQAELT